jgi:hypothetical protein
MIRRPKQLPYKVAVERMHCGSLLVRTNGSRTEYAVVPGGSVSNDTADRLLKLSVCRPADPGLLGDQPQSWRFDFPTAGAT